MAKQDVQGTSGYVGLATAPKLVGTIIVYSRKDGRIVHTAQFVHFGVGEAPTDAVMEQKVLNSVGARVTELDLAVLHHKGEPLKSKATYRVDMTGSAHRLIEQVFLD